MICQAKTNYFDYTTGELRSGITGQFGSVAFLQNCDVVLQYCIAKLKIKMFSTDLYCVQMLQNISTSDIYCEDFRLPDRVKHFKIKTSPQVVK